MSFKLDRGDETPGKNEGRPHPRPLGEAAQVHCAHPLHRGLRLSYVPAGCQVHWQGEDDGQICQAGEELPFPHCGLLQKVRSVHSPRGGEECANHPLE